MFKRIGTIEYAVDGYRSMAANILTAAVVKHIDIDKAFLYQKYNVPAGLTPEALAYKLYNDADLYWVLLYVNGIVNPFLDWPMDENTLSDWIAGEYGDINKVIHFKDVNTGLYIDDALTAEYYALLTSGDTLPYNIHPVTALEYETERNHRKSEIVIITPRYVRRFVDVYEKTIAGKA